MTQTDPRWKIAGLPMECPECGEDSDLAVLCEIRGDELRNVDKVSCGSCGHEWDDYDDPNA